MPPYFRSPLGKGRIADPVLAAQIRRAHARLVLFQNANDLSFAATASFHRLSPQVENTLSKRQERFRGAGQPLKHNLRKPRKNTAAAGWENASRGQVAEGMGPESNVLRQQSN
jgi:hypothetical protein